MRAGCCWRGRRPPSLLWSWPRADAPALLATMLVHECGPSNRPSARSQSRTVMADTRKRHYSALASGQWSQGVAEAPRRLLGLSAPIWRWSTAARGPQRPLTELRAGAEWCPELVLGRCSSSTMFARNKSSGFSSRHPATCAIGPLSEYNTRSSIRLDETRGDNSGVNDDPIALLPKRYELAVKTFR